MSTFYMIKHDFKAGGAAKWGAKSQEVMADQAGMAEWTKKVAEAGFFNHTFMMTSPEGPNYCIWESKEGKTPADMQNFIDGPMGPDFGTNTLINTVMVLDTKGAASPYPTKFAADAKPLDAPAPTNTKFFLIEHTFKQGKAEAWWGEMSKMMGDSALMKAFTDKCIANGFFNHTFMSTGSAGPCFCIWESKGQQTLEEMQTFIDGPDGPSMGALNNIVKPVLNPVGPYASKFAQPSKAN